MLKVAMIGVAGFGAWRRRTMRKCGRFRITACADRDPGALAQACAEEKAVACGSFDELLEQPGLQGVVISTGADSHADLAERAMRAGLGVFVEKPLCCSHAEAARLAAVQRETGVAFGVGHKHTGTDPVFQIVRSMIDSGRLGEVAAYEEDASHSGGHHIRENDWRGNPHRNPGGMLFQCGVHAIHRLNALFGRIDTVQAMLRYDVLPRTRTADVATVAFRHASGIVGSLNCFHVTGYCHELRIFGTGGNLYVDTYKHRAWYQEALYGPDEPRVEVPMPPTCDDTAGLMSWHDAIVSGSACEPSLADGIDAVLPVFCAEQSDREGRRLRVPSVLEAMPTTVAAGVEAS